MMQVGDTSRLRKALTDFVATCERTDRKETIDELRELLFVLGTASFHAFLDHAQSDEQQAKVKSVYQRTGQELAEASKNRDETALVKVMSDTAHEFLSLLSSMTSTEKTS